MAEEHVTIPEELGESPTSLRFAHVDIRLDEHHEILAQHSTKLAAHDERIKRLEDNHIRLENTIMAENRETRATITESNRQLYALLEREMGFNDRRGKRSHEFKMELWKSVAQIITLLVGSGGLLYFLLEQIFGGN